MLNNTNTESEAATIRNRIEEMRATLDGCDWCCGGGDEEMADLQRRLAEIEPEPTPEPELSPEMVAMVAELSKRAALWARVEALIDIKYTETDIVVGRAYNARHALKARGFRWEPISKTWRFVLTEYYAFRVSCGRLQDCKIRRHPEPINWIVDVAKALGVEA